MDLFTKTKKLTAITGAVSLLALGATGAQAGVNTVTTTITATVSNAITIAQTTALNFGKFGLIATTATAPTSLVGVTTGGVATYKAAGGGTDYAVKVTAPVVGVYAISGAAASTAINVSYDHSGAVTVEPTPGDTTSATLIPLLCSACTHNTYPLEYAITDNSTAEVITTDINGKYTLNLAGDITTDGVVTAYDDGTYTNAAAININLSY